MSDIDRLAQEIRRVDGAHALGAGALAEALGPFLEAVRAEAVREFADTLTRKGVYTLSIHDIRKYAREEEGL